MKIFLVSCIVLIVNIVRCVSQIQVVDPLVTIDQGTLRGHVASDGNYVHYLGIPFARVDYNDPFGPAHPSPSFGSEIFDANDGYTMCPQLVVNRSSIIITKDSKNTREYYQSIDCLKLNVYVPDGASQTNLLPVLVWIHGGTFASGASSHNHPRNLVNQGIVVVTMNYRLGVYGFMCLDTPMLPGNQGLKDQYEALKWIKNNIQAFGGNPDEVTIGGQSAGSSAVFLHLYTPQEKLFSKVITQSGTPQTEGMFVGSDLDAAIKIAAYLGFETSDTEEALRFLMQQSPETVHGAVTVLRIDMRPCREKTFDGVENFFSTSPYFLSNIAKVRGTPVLIGHTNQEENRLDIFGADYFSTNMFYNRLRDNYDFEEDKLVELAAIMKNFYVGDEEISEDLRWQLADFESDQKQYHPIQRLITKLLEEEAGPIYAYMFSYVGDTGFTAAPHTAELQYLFDTFFPGTPVGETEEDRILIARLTTMWANFVKYGNPVPETTELLPISWPPVSANARPYVNIDTELTLNSAVYNDRMAFWDVFFRSYGHHHRLYGADE